MMEDSNYKVILLGNLNVGKTSLFRKLKGDTGTKQAAVTESIDLRPYILKLKLQGGVTVQLEVNDTNSSERFRDTIPTTYYRRSHGVVLMYDVTNTVSLYNLEEWMNEVEQKVTEQNVTYAMIGNKLDKVDDEKELLEGNILRERFDIPEDLHFLISVKDTTTKELRQIFHVLATAIHQAQHTRERSDSNIHLTHTSAPKSLCCPSS